MDLTIAFAHKSHKGQKRKHSGLPYIVHPLSVLSLVAEWGITDLVVWRACVCHDILEERPDISVQQLAEVIGVPAADIVDELTFRPDTNDPMPQAEQKAKYMKTFRSKSVQSLAIKAADRMKNTWDFYAANPEYAKIYWRKGKDLMAALQQRQEEFVNVFGEAVFPRVMYSRTQLNSVLA